MKITDYSKIANKYDKNEFRQVIEQDNTLKEYIKQHIQPNYNVLDLACGTGINLYNQTKYFTELLLSRVILLDL